MTSDPIGDINDAQGRELVDRDGQPLGPIREIFLDEATGRPAWAAVDAPGGEGDLVLAPLAGSTREGDAIRVAVTRERVTSSPSTHGLTERFSPDHMDRVRAHYADEPVGTQPDMDHQSDVGHVAGTATSGDQTGTAISGELPNSMVRSEEELFIERERVPRERVRLVKRIVTETVTQTVEVRREELHLERVALTASAADATGADDELGGDAIAPAGQAPGSDPASGAGYPADSGAGGTETSSSGSRGLGALKARASELVNRAGERLGSGEHGFGEQFQPETLDLTLYEEELVVSKRVVPRERVRIHREIVTEQQRISDDLRKERVEVERIGLHGEDRVEGGYADDEPFLEGRGHRSDDTTL